MSLANDALEIKNETSQGANTANRVGSLLEKIVGSTGWAQYSDSLHTSGSPLVVEQGEEVILTNNAANSITGFLPLDVDSLYSNNKITPANSGDTYILRIDFTAYTNNNNGLAEIKLDIGGTQGVILKRILQFPRGAGISNAREFSTTNLIFTLDTFIANGGEIKVESVRGDTSIFDVSYVITRVHNNG